MMRDVKQLEGKICERNAKGASRCASPQGGKAAGKEKMQAQRNRYSYDSGSKAAGRDVTHGCSQPFQII